MKKAFNKSTVMLMVLVMTATLFSSSVVFAVSGIPWVTTSGDVTANAGDPPVVLTVSAQTDPPGQVVEYMWFMIVNGSATPMTGWSTSNTTYTVRTTFGPYYFTGTRQFQPAARLQSNQIPVSGRPISVTINGMEFTGSPTAYSYGALLGYNPSAYKASYLISNIGNIFGGIDINMTSCQKDGVATEPWCTLTQEFTVLTPKGEPYSSGYVHITPISGLTPGTYKAVYTVSSSSAPAINTLPLTYTFTVN